MGIINQRTMASWKRLHSYVLCLVCICAVLGSNTPEVSSFTSDVEAILSGPQPTGPTPEFEWGRIDEALKDFPGAVARAKLRSAGNYEENGQGSKQWANSYAQIASSEAETKCSAELDVREMLNLLPHSFKANRIQSTDQASDREEEQQEEAEEDQQEEAEEDQQAKKKSKKAKKKKKKQQSEEEQEEEAEEDQQEEAEEE